jgi:3-hydroxybutyryl-CoA dehydrogenase
VRLRPSPIQARLVDAGRLGRKTGEGFYLYPDGRRAGPAPEFAAEGASGDLMAARDRILAAIDREARMAVDEGVATPEEVDLALRLGAGHPEGPFERMARISGSP